MSARCSPERAVRELIQRLRNQAIVARWIGEQAVTIIRRELAAAWEAGRTGAPVSDAEVPADPTALHPGDIGDVEVSLTEELDALLADELDDALADEVLADELDDDLPAADAADAAEAEAEADAAEARSDGASSGTPFDGYDTLPASHIVQRLQRMSPDALRHVRAFEAAHRNRRTVLAMVDQLLAG